MEIAHNELSLLQPPVRQPTPNNKPAAQQQHPAPGQPKTPQKTTSLIVLSDSDDEIEMIITENSATKPSTTPKSTPTKQQPQRIAPQPSAQQPSPQKSKSNALPAELMQRISEGGVSISPVKPAAPLATSAQSTQLVVVVNETGSHYALALPNGSKLILTPEQVAQIRASNGGKLVL